MLNGYFVGTMTGTSLDGLDLVLVEMSDSKITVLDATARPYPTPLKVSIESLIHSGDTHLSSLGSLDHQLGQFYANSIKQWLDQLDIKCDTIQAIGNHGQTVWHEPDSDTPFTIQIGDNNIIAAVTGIPVVGDFRRMDMAYGGQGAPLVPAFHDFVFRSESHTNVSVNIGGIANISVMQPNQATYGFDTGPGNTLLDCWVNLHKKVPFDAQGSFAASGVCNTSLLKLMLKDPYFHEPHPKSTGREYFNLEWLKHQLAKMPQRVPPEDVQATLCQLTVNSIANALPKDTKSLIVCGGGSHNPLLMKGLDDQLPHVSVSTSATFGLDPDYVEAAAFAWLAYQRVNRQPGNCVAATGASQPAILGALYQP